MLSTINLSEALEIVVVLVGIILVLKRVVDMDNYHMTKVVTLTLILSIGVILLFAKLGVGLGNSGFSDCVIEFGGPVDHY